MGFVNKNNMMYYNFDNIEKTNLVNHCFTTRHGGVSTGVYAGFNLSFTRGEQRDNVIQNYRLLCENLGFDFDSFVLPNQTHTDNIRVVTQADKGKGVTVKSDIKETDGLITNVPGLNLVIFGADCVPVFLLDTKNHAIGVIHAGWRGTAMGIVKKAVTCMQTNYGTNPVDIVAGIGPSIGSCCFQVDRPVVDFFNQKLTFANEYITNDTVPDHFKIDLWQINKRLLIEAGVLPQNIEITGICTMCNTDVFYSHRVMGNSRGNMAGVMTLL